MHLLPSFSFQCKFSNYPRPSYRRSLLTPFGLNDSGRIVSFNNGERNFVFSFIDVFPSLFTSYNLQ